MSPSHWICQLVTPPLSRHSRLGGPNPELTLMTHGRRTKPSEAKARNPAIHLIETPVSPPALRERADGRTFPSFSRTDGMQHIYPGLRPTRTSVEQVPAKRIRLPSSNKPACFSIATFCRWIEIIRLLFRESHVMSAETLGDSPNRTPKSPGGRRSSRPTPFMTDVVPFTPPRPPPSLASTTP